MIYLMDYYEVNIQTYRGNTCNIGGGQVEQKCWVNFPCWGVVLVWMIIGHGPTALAVGAGGGVWTFFSHLSFSFFFPLFGRRPDMD